MGNVITQVDTEIGVAEFTGDTLSNPMEEAIFTDTHAPLIALIPLDSRPCNWLFPLRLADIAGVRLFVPPLEFLGWREKPGDAQALFDWLNGLPIQLEGILVSLDALLYGGLVQSRSADVREKSPEQIAEFLSIFLRSRPGCRLHCFKTVPRIGTTLLKSSDLALYNEILKKGQGAQADADADAEEKSAEPPTEKSPEEIEKEKAFQELVDVAYGEYLKGRTRNLEDHTELLASLLPMATSWCIAVEDGSESGPQLGEVDSLMSSISGELVRKVSVVNGCDEQGMVMLARHLRDSVEGRLPVGIWWSFPDSAARMAKFECFTAGQNLAKFLEHLRLSPIDPGIGTWSSDPQIVLGGADEDILKRKVPLLMINNFEREQGDHMTDGKPCPIPQYPASPIPFLGPLLLANLVDVYIADIAWANGGDPALDEAFAQGNGNYLSGYSSWNTAGNTFGKALAQIVCQAYRLANDPANRTTAAAVWAAERFKFESLLTDRWYPMIVRHRFWQIVTANGGDPWNFDLYTIELVEKGCTDLRKPMKSSYETKHRAIYRGRGLKVPNTVEPEINFPWNRLFEVDVRVYADDKYMDELFQEEERIDQ